MIDIVKNFFKGKKDAFNKTGVEWIAIKFVLCCLIVYLAFKVSIVICTKLGYL